MPAIRADTFAQPLLRNAGQLVCIDPSLGMAEFAVNSAIVTIEIWTLFTTH